MTRNSHSCRSLSCALKSHYGILAEPKISAYPKREIKVRRGPK